MSKLIKSSIQQCVEQIGTGFVPKGMTLHQCDIHGYYLAAIDNPNPICPLCIQVPGNANGTTASDIENKNKVDLMVNL